MSLQSQSRARVPEDSWSTAGSGCNLENAGLKMHFSSGMDELASESEGKWAKILTLFCGLLREECSKYRMGLPSRGT